MKKPTFIKSFIAVVGILILGLTACQEEFENIVDPSDNVFASSPNFKLLLTDAPFPTDSVAEANVTITKIEIRKSDEEEGNPFIILSEEVDTFNLLELTNGITETLIDTALESGTYDQIRLYVSDAEIILKNGEDFDLKVPGGAQSGIKIFLGEGITVSEEDTAAVLLDFDVSKSFIVKGNPNTPEGIKGFNFKPTIRVSNLATAGTLKGTVTDTLENPIEGAQVTIWAADSIYASASTEVNGDYKILGIEEGTYKVVFEETGFITREVLDVVIEEAETTKLNVALVPSEQ